MAGQQGASNKVEKCFSEVIRAIFPLSFIQGTSFGAVLDMVTDRCATTCLIMVLCFFYPNWLFVWQVLVALDISSHWVQMYMSLLHGETTHKVTDLSANPVMRLYYKKVRPILVNCT